VLNFILSDSPLWLHSSCGWTNVPQFLFAKAAGGRVALWRSDIPVRWQQRR